MTQLQADQRLSNYLRTYRRQIGLTQREMGLVLGYDDEGAVSKHEKFQAIPPLEIAFAYEIVFRAPLSELFSGLKDEVGVKIERRLAEMEEHLGRRSVGDRNARAIADKLVWLAARRNAEYETIQ